MIKEILYDSEHLPYHICQSQHVFGYHALGFVQMRKMFQDFLEILEILLGVVSEIVGVPPKMVYFSLICSKAHFPLDPVYFNLIDHFVSQRAWTQQSGRRDLYRKTILKL